MLLAAFLAPLASFGQFMTAPKQIAPEPLRDGCAVPTNLHVAPAPTWATATWISDNSSFDLRYIAADEGSAGLLTYDFEDGSLGDWTTIDADGDGNNWLANTQFGGHNGSAGIVYSQSYISPSALTPDNYLVSPQITLGGTITFWACAQDASYPSEHFGVAVSTQGNTSARPFTTIAEWDMTAKSMGKPTSFTRSGNRAQGTWYQYTVDLSDYNGQTGYVAIRHFNCTDWFYLDVDDITIEMPVELNWNEVHNIADNTYTITGLAPETEYFLQVRSNCGSEVSDWATTTFTTLEACPDITGLNATNIDLTSATINWTGYCDSYDFQYGVASTAKEPFSGDEWYYYDNGSYGTGIGLGGGAFSWGVMFPAGTYTGDVVKAVSAYNASSYPMTGTVTIYNDGTTAPAEEVGSMDITFDGVNDFTEYQFETPVSINPNKNVWVIFYNASGATYPAAASEDVTDDPNGRWVEINGTWYDVANAGVPGYSWMIRAKIGYEYDPSTVNWTSVTGATSPYNLTGLTPGTLYAVRVRGNCGDGTYTDWATTLFRTPSACGAPTALTAADIMPDAATLSWNGYQNNYQIQYRTASYRETFFFDDFETNPASSWSQNDGGWYTGIPHSGTHFVLMGYTSTETQYLISPELSGYASGSTVEFYQRYYQSATTFKVGYSSTTADVDAFTWGRDQQAASEYTLFTQTIPDGTKYIAIQTTAAAADNALLIEDFGVYGATIDAGTWQTIDNVSSPYTLNGLQSETEYEWQVRGVNSGCTGGYTDWAESEFFSTASACAAPYDLNADDVTATAATLSWRGYQDSYNVRYRTSEYADILFYEDFEEGELGDWTTANLEDGYVVDGMFAFHWTENPPQYLISPDISDILVEGSTLRFLCAAYDEDFPESFKVGYSSTGNAVDDFTWGEEYTISNTSGLYYTEAVPEGTKYFAVQCTSDDAYYFIVTDFMIYGPMTPAGDWEYVNDVTSPVTINGLTPDTYYDWQVQGAECGDDDWSEEDYFATLPSIQTVSMVSGINWFSANVQITLADLQNALTEALPNTGITIKASGSSTSYKPNMHRWVGQLNENLFSVAQMYLITITDDAEIELAGLPINPADLQITIVKGTNWIAYPLSESKTLDNAFAGFAANGDVVKGQNSSARRVGSRWIGQLTELTPGQGYLYTSNQDDPRTLVFPSSKGRSTKVTVNRLSKKIQMPKMTGLQKK